jgi:hypothetical protein
MRPRIPGQFASSIERPFTNPGLSRKKVTPKWRGDPLVRDFLTTREEKVTKNPLRKLLAEAREESRLSLLEMFVSPLAANKP